MSFTYLNTFLLAFSIYLAVAYTPGPCNNGTGTISVPIQNVSLIDGVVRWGVAITVGTPPQGIAFWPAAKANNTILFTTDQPQCEGPLDQCVAFDNGQFNVSASSTWISESDATKAGAAPDTADTVPTIGDHFGKDVLGISSSVSLEDFPIVIQTGENLGFNVLGLGPNSSILTHLYNNGITASRSYGLFWGLIGVDLDAQKDGSLTFGGYDKAKLTGTGSSQNIAHDNPDCNLLVSTTSITMNFPNGTETEILSVEKSPRTLTMCVDPEIPTIALPLDIWTNFKDNAGGGYIGPGLGLNRGNIYSVENVYAGDLTFKLGSGEQAVSVRIPNNQLVRPEIDENKDGVQTYNTSTRTVTIDSLQGGNLNDLPLLGQTFLTSSYLFVESDKDSFTIWQADPTSNQDVIPQVEIGSSFCTTARPSMTVVQQTSSPTSSGTSSGKDNLKKSSSNTGDTVGEVVGGLAAIVIIVAVVFFFLWRRRGRSGSNITAVASIMPDNNVSQYRDGSPLGSLNEFGGSQGLRREMGNEGARLELEAKTVRRELE